MQKRKYNQIITFSILLIIYLLIIFNVSADQKLICDFCKRAITNSNYVWVGDKYYHNEHFFCNECKKSLV